MAENCGGDQGETPALLGASLYLHPMSHWMGIEGLPSLTGARNRLHRHLVVISDARSVKLDRDVQWDRLDA